MTDLNPNRDAANKFDVSETGQTSEQTLGSDVTPANEAESQQDATTHRNRTEPVGSEKAYWWIALVVQPFLLIIAVALLIVGIVAAQTTGLLQLSTNNASRNVAAQGAEYICPMMCVPAQSEPGRCPVCGMELVPAVDDSTDEQSEGLAFSNSARRVANIQTVKVKAATFTRRVESIGEIQFNEGAVKTLSAYVSGRLEAMYADYTGVEVEKGDELAMLYSPDLYSGQVVYLQAREAMFDLNGQPIANPEPSIVGFLNSAKQRLVEMGMSEEQIAELDESGEPKSRLPIVAPISGTVVEKYSVEGQYITEGESIYKLVDLSSVWLTLEMFPEEANDIRYGQRVEAELQSQRGEIFVGRVAFVEPTVDPETRTVGVRVVIPNENGRIRIGDYATALVEIGVSSQGLAEDHIYDADLADKWISPRHPHIIRDIPGPCPICQIDLVPASTFGFTNQPTQEISTLTVPRNAVLMAGSSSVVYVETEEGRFELRDVKLGPRNAEQVVILDGLMEGEYVATSGNFLIDSQMQLAGRPSLIDPTRYKPKGKPEFKPFTEEELAEIEQLSSEQQVEARAQHICPVSKANLGSMGVPPSMKVEGRTVYLCCESCRKRVAENPGEYLANISHVEAEDSDRTHVDSKQAEYTKEELQQLLKSDPEIKAALSSLSEEDLATVREQLICPVAQSPLGSMGTPPKVEIEGKTIFICCEGCRSSLIGDPEKYLDQSPWIEQP